MSEAHPPADDAERRVLVLSKAVADLALSQMRLANALAAVLQAQPAIGPRSPEWREAHERVGKAFESASAAADLLFSEYDRAE